MATIVILTSVHRPDDVRVYQKEAVSLRKAGYKVILISPFKNGKDENGVQFVKGKSYKGRLPRLMRSARDYAAKALRYPADVYIFHDPELLPAGLKLKKKGKTVVYDVHEDVPRQILNKPWIYPALRKRLAHFFERYENRCAKRFDLVIAATPVIEKRFQRFHSHTITVNNYPILSEFALSKEDKREKIACYLGGLTRVRGLIKMIEAAKQMQGPLYLGGRFETQALKAEAEKQPGYENIKYVGYLNREKVSALLSKVSVGLVVLQPIPNYLESLPIKMFEYMAAGVPVVASNFPYWKTLLQDTDCAVFVDPNNPHEIAGAVNDLFDHPDRVRRMGENGRKKVLESFHWEKEEQKLLQAFYHLCQKKTE